MEGSVWEAGLPAPVAASAPLAATSPAVAASAADPPAVAWVRSRLAVERNAMEQTMLVEYDALRARFDALSAECDEHVSGIQQLGQALQEAKEARAKLVEVAYREGFANASRYDFDTVDAADIPEMVERDWLASDALTALDAAGVGRHG